MNNLPLGMPKSVNWGGKIKQLSLLVILSLVLSLLMPLTAVPEPALANNKRPKASPYLLRLAQSHPNDMFRIIVQKDASQKNALDEEPEQTVKNAGGKVKKKLGLINGFAAQLSGRELEKLVKRNKVRWIAVDAPLFSTALVTSTVLDGFNAMAFHGNGGNQNWSSDWQELGEADGPDAGKVKVAGSPDCATGYCLIIGASLQSIDGLGVSRQVDLSRATSATLSFNYKRSNTSGETGSVNLQVSGDGGTGWATLATYTLDASDSNPVSASFDILPYVAPNTQIRFIGSGSADRDMLIDNVKIDFATSTNLANAPDFEMLRDDSLSAAYDENDGTQSWSTSWIESDANGGAADSGNISLVASSADCLSGGYCLSVSSFNPGDDVYRTADLSGTASATLTLWRNNLLTGLNNNDSIVLEVSTDGNTWTTLRTWGNIDEDLGAAYENFDLTPYLSVTTSLRFRVAAGTDGGHINFDNIQIQYTPLQNIYNRAIGADKLWREPPYLDGQGVTVAVVDSGFGNNADLQVYGGGTSRIVTSTTTVTNSVTTEDGYGHGTAVAGIVGGNGNVTNGERVGVAPGVNLINVKVANDQGMSYTSDLLNGLQWINDNRAAYNIRVVNISLNSVITETYQTNVLDAATEMLWLNGIVVVVSAGNNGNASGPVPLYPPANDPFVITVGAVNDQGTMSLNDDVMALFSAYGTTEDGFAKPDLVAPGQNIIGLLASPAASLYIDHPANRLDNAVFRMSGTSMSAPMVSGAAALLLQDEPNLTPDQIKYRLMATANRNWPSYDAMKAGAGYVDAYAAVHGTTTLTANTGITVSQALTGTDASNWGSMQWGSMQWGSMQWGSDYWGP